MKITYLEHNKIDFEKWDKCIDNAFNGIVYAYSWYLDIVCEGWEALIADDYKFIMPLTCGEKYKIKYLYQPIVTQQLGVFSTEKLNQDSIDIFLSSIPEKYRFIEISLNSYNKASHKDYIKKSNKTFLLDLIKPYDLLLKSYATNTKRNIKKAVGNKLNVVGSPSINDILDLLYKDNAQVNKGLKEKHFNMLRQIMSNAIGKGMGQISGVYDEHNDLCAAAFFINSHNKTIFLLAVSNKNGKDNRAMFILVDDFIKNNSDKKITLDFEGSNIPGVARFYGGFGASSCDYLSIKRNRLPFFLRLIKK